MMQNLCYPDKSIRMISFYCYNGFFRLFDDFLITDNFDFENRFSPELELRLPPFKFVDKPTRYVGLQGMQAQAGPKASKTGEE